MNPKAEEGAEEPPSSHLLKAFRIISDSLVNQRSALPPIFCFNSVFISEISVGHALCLRALSHALLGEHCSCSVEESIAHALGLRAL